MGKKSISKIFSKINQARDNAQHQMTSLRHQADKEHKDFESEWRELGRLIENDKKMFEFLKSKMNDSSDQPAVKKATSPKAKKVPMIPAVTREDFEAEEAKLRE